MTSATLSEKKCNNDLDPPHSESFCKVWRHDANRGSGQNQFKPDLKPQIDYIEEKLF